MQILADEPANLHLASEGVITYHNGLNWSSFLFFVGTHRPSLFNLYIFYLFRLGLLFYTRRTNSWGFAGQQGEEGYFEEGGEGRGLGGRRGCMEKYNFGHFGNDLGGGTKGCGDGRASAKGNEFCMILIIGYAYGDFNFFRMELTLAGQQALIKNCRKAQKSGIY